MKKIPIRQLSPAQFELRSPERFKIRRVEDIVGESDLVHDLHRHDFFFILAIRKGKGTHEIDFTPYPVTGHSVFYPPGPGASAGIKNRLHRFSA